MKHNVEHVSETRAKLSVEVPASEFEPKYNKAAKDLAQQVDIPGFRKGKAPRRVLESKIGRGYIIEQAINDNLDGYYQIAVVETGIVPMSRPEVDIVEVPEMTGKDDTTALKFTVEVDVRPEIWLPNPADFTVEVPSAEVTDDDVTSELDALRERFATLTNVDREAKEGDYVNIDMVATIGGENVDDVAGISYRIGEGNMLDGQDEALTGAKADDVVEFKAKLAGGEHEGEEADVTITVHSVKESVLPEADDDFAMMASEFDTIDELREDLREQAAKHKANMQLSGAHELLVNQLVEASDFPLPQGVIDEEVANHLSNEGKEADDPHGEEIRPEIEQALRQQLLLDTYVEAFKVDVPQEELIDFLVTQAQMYGMDPNQFIQAAAQAGQIGAFSNELARNKAVTAALRLATVKDSDGNDVDVAAVLGEQPENEVLPEFTAKPAKADKPKKAKADKADKPKKAVKAKADEAADEESATDAADGEFDPAAHTVGEVLDYVGSVDEAEKARVLAAEKDGKNRKGIVSKLEG
ncbi:trigger factor [Trueperella bialowiezensis]|uniref:Trigger factor n=1 Tax=Trueperella bialowiezensis TaxID=312285 RepID=A0A3S4YX14_9ACTO|nr:trigger factor [Trueperella bialowiezensis]VEI12718.1 Trigger factor [Trueperella bialowiezensis]